MRSSLILTFALLLATATFAQDYSSMFHRWDMAVWEQTEASASAIVPHSSWLKIFSSNDWGTVRYDYPLELVEYGVPGCQVWDLNSPKGKGPVYFEHVLHTDYIEMKAPAGHLIQWTCHGLRFTDAVWLKSVQDRVKKMVILKP